MHLARKTSIKIQELGTYSAINKWGYDRTFSKTTGWLCAYYNKTWEAKALTNREKTLTVEKA